MYRKKSDKLFKEAQKVLVGGVNSPVRAFSSVGGNPVFISRAKGPYIWDADGNRYIDFVGSWGPMILGHANREVSSSIEKAISNGFSYGAPTEIETKLARLVCEAYPSIEKTRFVSSGTEATMTALRLARAYTRREFIVKFSGCYHGHSDSLLVKAGSGATTLGIPDSAGVPKSLSQKTVVLPYNDSVSLERCFHRLGKKIACVIVEPVAANMGLVLPEKRFLSRLRELTSKFGSALIFDEVITGFRLAFGGAQEIFGIRPDLTCLGKILGGGFPVGAVGGIRKIMDNLAPLGPVYQAGTLSGNPVAMASGLATLTALKRSRPWPILEKRTENLVNFLKGQCKSLNLPVQINQIGSLFTIFFSKEPVRDYQTALKSDRKLFAKFHRKLMEKGIYFPPSQFEAAFVSGTHDENVLNRAGKAIAETLKEISREKGI